MNLSEFLTELRTRDIRIWAEGDQLRCSARTGVLTPELREELKSRKGDILAFLRAADQLAGQQRAIVPLQPRGTQDPVFAVGGHNGDVFAYRQLVQHLGADQPFFGLQPPGLDGSSQPIDGVEKLAGYFAEQVRAVRPRGPLIVTGFCAGGAIALELASQLHRGGVAVRFVALFGCPHPSWFRWYAQLPRCAYLQMQRGGKHLRALKAQSWADRGRYVADKLRAHRAKRTIVPPPPDPVIVMRTRLEQVTLAAVRGYEPALFPGRLVLFMPSPEWVRESYAALKWHLHAVQVDEYRGPANVTGDNMLLEPNASVFAELFRRSQLGGP